MQRPGDAQNIDSVDTELNSALRPDVINYLNPNHVETDHPYWTALHRAVYNLDEKRIKWLIDNGAKVTKDKNGHYPHQVCLYEPWRDNQEKIKERAMIESLVNPNHIEINHFHWTALSCHV